MQALIENNKCHLKLMSPQIAPIPEHATKRLIDSGMIHLEASLAGLAERYGRGETSHTIHVWWARRPHSAMRALVFSSLCKDITRESFEILKQITISSSVSTENIYFLLAKNILKSNYPQPPRVLDMFGGGGTIPEEASKLGAKTYSIDSNELSVFIQRCNLIYSQEVKEANISKIIKESGTRVLNQLFEETNPFFPLRNKYEDSIFGYLWTYTIDCPNCGYRFYLSKRPWLSKKKGKFLALLIENGEEGQKVKISNVPHSYTMETVWVGKNGTVECPKCHEKHSEVNIKKCRDELVGLIRRTKKSGKEFLPPDINAVPSMKEIADAEKKILQELGEELPKSKIPLWSGIANPAIYGIETHSDFLNPRQRIVLLSLIKALKDEYFRLKEKYKEGTVKYVISVLSSLVDQLIDWNSRLSMWIPQNEQVGRSFCGPGISMLWDYVETDPVLNGPANLWGKLDRILAGVDSLGNYDITPHIEQGFAQALPFENNFFDAIITDPPYYDNIFYSVLADFFFAWKRLILRLIEPNLFKSDITNTNGELVASKFRSHSPQKAHEDYCQQLTLAIKEAARVLKDDGIFSFIYSHSSVKGWEAFVRAFRSSNFIITSVQPLSIERKQRPRAMTSEAVNTCIAFVCRKTKLEKNAISLSDLVKKLRIICIEFAPGLLEAGWNKKDAALAAFANSVGMLANAKTVVGVQNDLEALKKCGNVVNEYFPEFKLKIRDSL